MNKKSYVFLLFNFCFIACWAQLNKDTYTNRYDLNFTMRADTLIEYPWLENAAYSNHTIPVYIKDPERLLYARKYIKEFPFSDRLKTEIEQRILLPVHDEIKGVIQFEGKGQNIKSVSIISDLINGEEKIIYSDTMNFVPNETLNMVSKEISLKDAELLNIRIHAEGIEHKDASIVFSNLRIIIGNKSIDEYPIRKLSSFRPQKEIDYIPIKINNKADEAINIFDNHKIIALGESLHGNSAVKNLAYQLIMEMIEKQNCKLVIVEQPLEKTLALDRYVENSNFELDSTMIIESQTMEFLNQLNHLLQSRRI